MKGILQHMGGLLVDFVGLFLGYPELDGHPRRSVGEALAYLSLLALVAVAFYVLSC